MNLVYYILSSKLIFVPIFKWENMKLSVRSNCKPKCNWILNFVILYEFCFRVTQISVLAGKRDINGSVLQCLLMGRIIAHFFLRVNMWIFRTELVRLINQAAAIDTEWGKEFVQIICRLKIQPENYFICLFESLISTHTGNRRLNTESKKWTILSKLRGYLLSIVLSAVAVCVILIDTALIYIRREEYSVFNMVKTFTQSILLAYVTLIIFYTVQIFLLVDVMIYSVANFGSIYTTCFIMKFWLGQIW